MPKILSIKESRPLTARIPIRIVLSVTIGTWKPRLSGDLYREYTIELRTVLIKNSLENIKLNPA